MSQILAVPVFLELYKSCDTLFVCFHGLMDIWQLSYFPNLAFLKTGILKNLCDNISRTYCVQVRLVFFWLDFFSPHGIHLINVKVLIYFTFKHTYLWYLIISS